MWPDFPDMMREWPDQLRRDLVSHFGTILVSPERHPYLNARTEVEKRWRALRRLHRAITQRYVEWCTAFDQPLPPGFLRLQHRQQPTPKGRGPRPVPLTTVYILAGMVDGVLSVAAGAPALALGGIRRGKR